ncbi:unnamed protein product [Rotaria sordida]|uniref:Peptidase M14 domain-containing protein n=2 Tax=Rotaria sordida TaxID=392033 RepID=A0A813VZ74_9BILA|nr:unnamed protein product [Rotaria sordida]
MMLQHILLLLMSIKSIIGVNNLMTINDNLIDSVPEYTRFFKVDELFNHARITALQHSNLTRYQIVGHSRNAEAIPMLSIGNGSKSVLLYACPHPNEPIGSLLVDFLLDALFEHTTLLMKYTWHLLPCVDPDGTRLNEGWFAGPFTIRHYAQYYYRPAVEEQVEWTFPITHKKYSWNKPPNETQALMNAIQLAQPDFVYGLHNSGFGGMYYYISPPMFDIFPELERLPSLLDLFLATGEPETPWIIQFAPGIFRPVSLRTAYDYYEKYTTSDPVTIMSGGGTTFDYLEDIGLNNSIFLMAELPHFQSSAAANDTIIPNMTRRDVLLLGLDKDDESSAILVNLLKRIQDMMTLESPFYRASCSLLNLYKTRAAGLRQALINDNSTLIPATVARYVDTVYISMFYKMLVASMFNRAILLQLTQSSSNAKILEDAHIELESYLTSWISDIEQNLSYSLISIRKVVQAQLGAMLAVLPKV